MNRNRAGEPAAARNAKALTPKLFVDDPTPRKQNVGVQDAREREAAWQATQDLCQCITSRAGTAVLASGNGLPSLAAGLLGN